MNVEHYKDNIYITGQVQPDEVESLVKDYGFTMIVNNRIDGEAPLQPSSDKIEKACKTIGVQYCYLPMRDRLDITTESLTTRNQILETHKNGRLLFFCRTGGRSESLLSRA